MGGLARRVGYIISFKLRSNQEVPALFVDAGNLFTDDRAMGSRLPDEDLAKNRWVTKSYGKFNHDAANVTYNDFLYLSDLLKKDGYQERLQEYPFIAKIVSANVHPTDKNLQPLQPYVIREVSLKRGKPGATIKIGIAGFTEAKPQSPTDKPTAFEVEDPFAAAKRVIPELKKKVDYVIALAYMAQPDAQRLATEVSGIDTIIAAHQVSAQDEPQKFNQTTVTTCFYQTKQLGELRYYIRSDGVIENQKNRYIALDDAIPDDPNAAEYVADAHTDFTNEINKAQQIQQADVANADTAILSGKSLYIGQDSCAGCHQKEAQIWQKSGHAHAMETLQKRNQHLDADCVKCHVVGFQKGRFQALYSTPQFANVQCEACHGPGRVHAENPQKGYGFVQTPQGCVVCHTQNNSPDFNFATYWPKIKH